MKDTDLIERLINGQLMSACRLCLCPLQGSGAATLNDILAIPTGDVRFESYLHEKFPDLQLSSWLSSQLSDKICFKCLREVKTDRFEPLRKTDFTSLLHYVDELYGCLTNTDVSTVSNDAKAIVLRLKPLFKAEQIEERKDYVYFNVPGIKNELTDTENIDLRDGNTLLIVEKNQETYNPDEFRPPIYYYKRVTSFADGEEVEKLQLAKYARKKAPKLSCKICKKKYSKIDWLVQHEMKMHGIIICEECEEHFECFQEYSDHVAQHATSYTCDLCGHGFTFRHAIILHLLKHEREKWEACVCQTCGAQLWDATSLEQHVRRTHSEQELTHTCFYCGRGYRSALSYEAHLRSHETQPQKHSCDECGFTFPTRASLARHARNTHQTGSVDLEEGKKVTQFQCEECSRCLVDARALRWHARLHSGERPHRCDECSRAFVSRYRRNQHALTAHTAPQRRCPLCPALFHLRSMVNTHIKKVHLREHARRRRAPRGEAQWPTQRVSFSELSVAVQTQLIDKALV